jgi:hypothetical protein
LAKTATNIFRVNVCGRERETLKQNWQQEFSKMIGQAEQLLHKGKACGSKVG